MKILEFLRKIYTSFTIIVLGGIITFGVNLFLLFLLGDQNVEIANDKIFILLANIWLIELFIIIIYALYRVFFKKNYVVPTRIENPQTTNLMSTLSKIDISDISSVIFTPINGQGFIIKTPNIKQLAVYITTKKEKNIFKPDELRIIFDYIVLNLSSNLSNTDFNLIESKISQFVKSGGEVRINKL